MTAMMKREVESYGELTASCDKDYSAHGTWPTGRAYAEAVLSLVRRAGFTESATASLLDVACGGGVFVAFAASVFGKVAACDISEVAVRQTRERCPEADARQANAEQLPYADASFDVVTCLGALEHFMDPDRALDEIRRVLTPRGVAIILVPTNPAWIQGDVQPTEIVMTVSDWSARFRQHGLASVANEATDSVSDLKRGSAGCHLYALRPVSRTDARPSDATAAVGGLTPADLADVLRRLDENLQLRSVLRDPGGAAEVAPEPVLAAPADLEALRGRIEALRMLRAPLFVLGGPVLSAVAWACNLPIQLLLRKQIRFNEEVLGVLDGLREQAALLRRCSVPPEGASDPGPDTRTDATSLMALAVELRGQATWMKSLVDEVRGQAEWIRVIQSRVEGLSMDVRDGFLRRGTSEPEGLPEPRVVDPAEYARKTAAMPDGLRVNVGCGEKPMPEAINVDRREQPGVDIVADVRRLPFEAGSVAELRSAHLVEHFRAHVFRTRVLPGWVELLRAGGAVRIICPDWDAMLKRHGEGRMSLPDFTRITFGGQDYEGNDHFAMYTPESMSEVLRACGLERVVIVARDRMVGGCPEMEVVGYR